ncbi:hypothetical protein NDU88_002240 [Pleurodeles waltl]|uniref:Uncharacterized protein n=1 Tax=Pleurodeles waltl TaxID=8319 RepID=A0AAV7T2T9_PLEWA|nr:hypothetical protein NDU88_002240 [Pleurodeles waltl]
MIVEVGGGQKLSISGQGAANPAQRACLQSPPDFKMTSAVRDEPEVIIIAGGSVVCMAAGSPLGAPGLVITEALVVD